MSARLLWCGAALLVIANLAVACSSGAGDRATAAGDQPNVLFILTDDMTVSDLAAMPHLQQWLGEEGTSFTRAYVSNSLCCPSRVTMLRGQYAHNTGVLSNEGTQGGFTAVQDRGLEASTVATWLQDVGYRTGLIGKYLNYYPLGAGVTYVPPGWDEWDSTVSGSSEAGYDYTLNENGRLVAYGDRSRDYASAVFVDRTLALARAAAAADDPFFAWLAVDAPHEPATPAHRDADAYADATAPHTPSYDVVDPSAPPWVSSLPPMTTTVEHQLDDRQRHRLASLRSLDRELARLAHALDESGQLDDTYVVFTSDNGFHLGQHRLGAGKQSAFEEDIRVPLLVRGPGVPRGATSDALVANVDLAPTFAELAGATTPDFVDGRSLATLWRGDEGDGARHAVLLEHWLATFAGTVPASTPSTPSTVAPSAEAPAATATTTPTPSVFEGQTESGSRPVAGAGPQNPSTRHEGPAPGEFHGLRTGRYTYVEYDDGEVELYDDETDPDQIHNLAERAPEGLVEQLHALLDSLADCAGSSCRDGEAADVP